jgi:hypothetical protein
LETSEVSILLPQAREIGILSLVAAAAADATDQME